jgi:CubicO group peptidase (beta-lactamase class C family)
MYFKSVRPVAVLSFFFLIPAVVLGGVACATSARAAEVAGTADATSGDARPLLLDTSAKAVAADLDAAIPGLLREGHVPGLQVALIRDGRVVWSGAFGVANADSGTPVTSETIFEAASLTKPFFAYFVMKMVDEGVVDLDKPIVGCLPKDEVEKLLGHPVDLEGFRRDWLERITPRHVLSHSSGLPHGEGGKPYPIFFEPGTQYKYSAEGYFLLQRAIELLKGRSLDVLMKEYVIDPLGMTRSSMVWRESYESTMANGHEQFGALVEFRRRNTPHAGASLYTTAEDYARFVCAVVNGEGLKEATWREMLSPQVVVDEAMGLSWSLGFGLQSDTNGPAFWQWGDYGIFRNYVIAYPGRRTGIVYLANSFNGLTICRELVARGTGGAARGVEFLKYLQYDSPVLTFLWAVYEQGAESVERILPGMIEEHPDLLSAESMRMIVGLLDNAGLNDAVIAVLTSVAGKIPPSANTDFTLASACMKKGDFAKARENCRKALASPDRGDFDTTRVDWAMSFMKAVEEPASLESDYLAALAGDYGPRHITLDGGRLYYLRDGVAAKNRRELIPLSRDTFVIREIPYFRMRFELDESGRPTRIVGMYEGGAEDSSPRN